MFHKPNPALGLFLFLYGAKLKCFYIFIDYFFKRGGERKNEEYETSYFLAKQ